MKWDCIVRDFLSLSHAEQLALVEDRRRLRRMRYVPPPKPERKKKEVIEIDGVEKPKRTRKPKQTPLEKLNAMTPEQQAKVAAELLKLIGGGK